MNVLTAPGVLESERRDPSVTVVIPTRNRVEMLSQTLKSVLDQEHVDLEVALMKDPRTRR